jgi:hypothetical protein
MSNEAKTDPRARPVEMWTAEISGKKVRFSVDAFLESFERLRATGADVYLSDYVEAVVLFLAANHGDLQDAVSLLAHTRLAKIADENSYSIRILRS